MIKYSKRLMAVIRFWCQECKIRSKENAELERIENEAFSGIGHPMAGLSYYKQVNYNRKERRRLHEEQLAALR